MVFLWEGVLLEREKLITKSLFNSKRFLIQQRKKCMYGHGGTCSLVSTKKQPGFIGVSSNMAKLQKYDGLGKYWNKFQTEIKTTYITAMLIRQGRSYLKQLMMFLCFRNSFSRQNLVYFMFKFFVKPR